MARAVLVALLVACSLVGTAVGAPPPQPAQPSALSEPASTAQIDDDREPPVEMLGLDSPTRSVVTAQGVDVSTAAAMQREAADAAIERGTLEVAFERAEDEQARRQLLFEAATDVEIAAADLRSEQRDVRTDFVNETVTAEDYVRSRAVATVRTEQLLADLELIQLRANQVPQLSMRSRIEALRVGLTGADGPVSDRIRAGLVGEGPVVETYVAASPDGRVMAVVADGEYVREAYRSDVWTPDATSGVDFAQAEERTKELYPVAFNSSRNLRAGMTEHGAGTYQITLEVREGDIVTYLDGDSRNVFFEVQRFRLGAVEPGPSISEADNGTRLIVNRTYDGGPLRVATADNASGAPTDLPVLVGETRYHTGSDGEVWALAPGGRTRVVAIGEAGNVTVTATPMRQSLVNVTPIET